MHKHLRRLDRVWIDCPLYFITVCTMRRRGVLHRKAAADILVDEWRNADQRHGWVIGRYVIMPDHVHFFCAPQLDAKTLSQFIAAWKQWTSKRIMNLLPRSATAATTSLWQREFFDHVLRSDESYAEKWNYVLENPVRAGLVSDADNWKYSGEIEQLIR